MALYILYGPIASGKSTYAREAADGGAVIVNDDAIVTALHGGNYQGYIDELKPLYKATQTSIITHTLAMGLWDVVVDSTGLRRATRDRLRLLGEAFDVPVNLVVFREGIFWGEEDGDRRYDADPRGHTRLYWRKVGEAHAKKLEPLTANETRVYNHVLWIPWEERNTR